MQNVHKCPCATVREIKQFTVHLLGDRLEKLKNSELRQLADKIIDAAIVEVNDGKEKRSNLRTSFISSRKDEIKRSVVRIVEKLSKNGGNLCDEEKSKLQGAYRIMLKGRPKKNISAKNRGNKNLTTFPSVKLCSTVDNQILEQPKSAIFSKNTTCKEGYLNIFTTKAETVLTNVTKSPDKEQNVEQETHHSILPELPHEKESPSRNTSEEECSETEDVCCKATIPVAREKYAEEPLPHCGEQQTHLLELIHQKEFSSLILSDEQYSIAEDICFTATIPDVPEKYDGVQLDNLLCAKQQTHPELHNQKETRHPYTSKQLCSTAEEILCPDVMSAVILKDKGGPLQVECRQEEETQKSQKQKTQIDKLIKMRCYGFCGSKLPEIQMLNLECQKLEAQLNALQITLLKSRHVQRLQ